MKHVHFIGIGGAGLSAIALILLEKGFAVSGSDRECTSMLSAITDAGARVFLGHAPQHIEGADLVIRSSAIPDENPEVVAALAKGIPVIKRQEYLAELTAGKLTLPSQEPMAKRPPPHCWSGSFIKWGWIPAISQVE